MSLLQTIRNKPHAEKVRIIWVVVAVTIILLIGLWIVSSKMGQQNPFDPNVKRTIETLQRGFKDTRDNIK